MICRLLFRWLLIAVITLPAAIQAEITALYLTWQRSPETTMTICWLTPLQEKNDTIEYRPDTQEGISWQKATGSQMPLPQKIPYTLHMTELTGLQPGTKYVMRVVNEDKLFKFCTAPAALDGEIRFVVGGDMYHDTLDILHSTNKEAAKTSPLFALIGGDIAYAAGKGLPSFLPEFLLTWFDEWRGQHFDRWLLWLQAWYKDMMTPEGCLIPLLPVLGNHEVNGGYGKTPAEAPFFYALFPMPGKRGYNVLDFGDYLSILLLDSGHTHPINGRQAKWLAETLEARKNVRNKFAIYHVPAYPSVRSEKGKYNREIRRFWVPSFDKYHLTAAFENHDHAYKRTYPLTNSRYDPNGVYYFGDGSWGIKDPRKPRRVEKKGYLEVTAQERYFHLLKINGKERTMQALKDDGTVFDELHW